MRNEHEGDDETYKVVVSHAVQYSICPARSRAPAGWREVGLQGRPEECLDYIKEVSTDMRPLSLREWPAWLSDATNDTEIYP
jgi:MbtH protein